MLKEEATLIEKKYRTTDYPWEDEEYVVERIEYTEEEMKAMMEIEEESDWKPEGLRVCDDQRKEARRMKKTICPKCGKEFESSKAEKKPNCFDCELASLTNGLPIEQGDINSARITSGTLSHEEEETLFEDLEAVEEGRSVKEYFVIEPCHYCGEEAGYCGCDQS